METLAKVKDHLKSAEEFYALGVKEYEEGRLGVIYYA